MLLAVPLAFYRAEKTHGYMKRAHSNHVRGHTTKQETSHALHSSKRSPRNWQPPTVTNK